MDSYPCKSQPLCYADGFNITSSTITTPEDLHIFLAEAKGCLSLDNEGRPTFCIGIATETNQGIAVAQVFLKTDTGKTPSEFLYQAAVSGWPLRKALPGEHGFLVKNIDADGTSTYVQPQDASNFDKFFVRVLSGEEVENLRKGGTVTSRRGKSDINITGEGVHVALVPNDLVTHTDGIAHLHGDDYMYQNLAKDWVTTQKFVPTDLQEIDPTEFYLVEFYDIYDRVNFLTIPACSQPCVRVEECESDGYVLKTVESEITLEMVKQELHALGEIKTMGYNVTKEEKDFDMTFDHDVKSLVDGWLKEIMYEANPKIVGNSVYLYFLHALCKNHKECFANGHNMCTTYDKHSDVIEVMGILLLWKLMAQMSDDTMKKMLSEKLKEDGYWNPRVDAAMAEAIVKGF